MFSNSGPNTCPTTPPAGPNTGQNAREPPPISRSAPNTPPPSRSAKDIYGQYIPLEPPPIRKNGYVPIYDVSRSNVEYIHDVSRELEYNAQFYNPKLQSQPSFFIDTTKADRSGLPWTSTDVTLIDLQVLKWTCSSATGSIIGAGKIALYLWNECHRRMYRSIQAQKLGIANKIVNSCFRTDMQTGAKLVKQAGPVFLLYNSLRHPELLGATVALVQAEVPLKYQFSPGQLSAIYLHDLPHRHVVTRIAVFVLVRLLVINTSNPTTKCESVFRTKVLAVIGSKNLPAFSNFVHLIRVSGLTPALAFLLYFKIHDCLTSGEHANLKPGNVCQIDVTGSTNRVSTVLNHAYDDLKAAEVVTAFVNTAGNNTAGNNTTGGAASHLGNVVHPDAASAHFTDLSDKSSGVQLPSLRQVGLDGLLEELPSNAPVGGKNTEQQAKFRTQVLERGLSTGCADLGADMPQPQINGIVNGAEAGGKCLLRMDAAMRSAGVVTKTRKKILSKIGKDLKLKERLAKRAREAKDKADAMQAKADARAAKKAKKALRVALGSKVKAPKELFGDGTGGDFYGIVASIDRRRDHVVVDWDDGERMAASVSHITAVDDQEFESMKAGPCLFVPCSDGENSEGHGDDDGASSDGASSDDAGSGGADV